MRLAACAAILAGWFGAGALLAEGLLPQLTPEQNAEAARLVAGFKTDPRGPFFRIRWFCNDGTDHPPSPYPCAERGGGRQHATLSDGARKLRGWNVDAGTILAAMTDEEFVDAARDHHRLKQIVLEGYLRQVDDGWIDRRAFSYRGARQAEDEERAGRRRLTALFSDPDWLRRRMLLANQLVASVPHGAPDSAVRRIRTLATAAADADARFQPIRAKIHSAPDAAQDLRLVEEFVRSRQPAGEARERLDELAKLLREQDAGRAVASRLPELRALLPDGPGTEALGALNDFLKAKDERAAWEAGGKLSAFIAREIARSRDGKRNLALLDAQAALLDFGFQTAPRGEGQTRRQSLDDLAAGFDYAFGAGLLSERQMQALAAPLAALKAAQTLPAAAYFEAVRDLARSAEWARATAAREFGPVADLYRGFEPKAAGFLDDLLRGSPAFDVAERLEGLVTDAGRAVGVRHTIFGAESGAVVGLNPGRARAVLDILDGPEATVDSRRIYVVPRTVSDLKPMAGVLTLDSGNALSHTQLLASNLGIPNAVVPSSLMEALRPWVGREIEFEVGPRGDVRLAEAPPEKPKAAAQRRDRFALDLSALRLDHREVTPLERLGEWAPGEICGPKAYNLARLADMFPGRVAPAMVVPFGVFAAHIDRPLGGDTEPLAERIRQTFAEAEAMRAGGAAEAGIEAFLYPRLAEFRERIRRMPLLPGFEAELRAALDARFGPPGSFGVFVRSDTNAEDLPEFTGAGLNLTVPNVVGTEKIVQALKDVWASPFVERAYEWRSRALTNQESVFPSALLMRTVRADKSGVLATIGLESGDRTAITANLSEGVSAVVDGGVAESLLLRADGSVKLLHQARATYRKVADPAGGFRLEPPLGEDHLLAVAEIAQIRQLVAEVDLKYPKATGPDGRPAPWDIELGFEGGKLQLFQIRPLALRQAPQPIEGGEPVALDEVPR